VTLTDIEGALPEYVAAHIRYYGQEQGRANTAELERTPGVRMVRIALRPSWVGVIDFQTRFPAPMAEAMSP
jgi:hypothetical protein